MLHTILFDLDGTLVDSAEDITASALSGFAEVGAPADRARLMTLLGYSLRELYDTVVADGNAERRDRFTQAYRRHYALHCTDRTVVYPGVRETLAALHRFRLGVATTKLTATAEQILRALDLAEAFDVILGSDGLPSKPDPAVLRQALARLGATPREALMVGDTDRDVLAAQRAGMRAVAVTYGGWTRERLEPLRPDALVDRFEELPGVLVSL
jgi:phosphoglycolate phosphatase